MSLTCRLPSDRSSETIGCPERVGGGRFHDPRTPRRCGMPLQPLQYVATRPRSSTTKRTSYILTRKYGPHLKGVMAVVGRSAMSKELMATYKHSKRVGPYLLGPTIGEGSFAKVKEAMHVLIGEKVAIKIIDKRDAREDAYLHKTLRREAGLLQLLGHTHIVRLLEVMETDNNLYLVLELCGGGPLLERVCTKGGLEEGVARRYIKQVASAVYHMHQMGVVHRDLKVENLLLDDNDKIRIIDFGLSNFIGNLERETDIRDARKRDREFSSRKEADARSSRRQGRTIGVKHSVSGDGGGAGRSSEAKGVTMARLPSDGAPKRRVRGASFREESNGRETWHERAAGLQRKSSKEHPNMYSKSNAKQNGIRVPGGENVHDQCPGHAVNRRKVTAEEQNSPDKRRNALRNRVQDVFGTRDFAGTLCGSPAYAAPEIIARKRYGPKVDVWSIGVNAYAILTGTLPFIVEPFNLRQLLSKIQKGDMAPLPSGLSSDCKSFIRYLLEPDPEKRPTIFDVICHPWLAGVFEPLRSLNPTDPSYALTPSPPPTPCPSVSGSGSGRRVSRMLLDHDIVNYIRETLGIKSTHVSESVLAGRADEYSAIYYLLAKQRERDEVPKIAQRLQENWETFRACSRQDDHEDDVDIDEDRGNGGIRDNFRGVGDAAKKQEGSPGQRRPVENEDDEGKKTVATETALQIAGKKNGSFHFKMAMVIEEEADRAARTPSPRATQTSAIYREVLGEVHPQRASSSTSPAHAKSTSSKDEQRPGTPFGQPQRHGKHGVQSFLSDSRVSAASGNPWIIMLGRERTTSTIRTGISGRETHIDNRNVHQAGVTTSCFKGDPAKKKCEKSQVRTEKFENPRKDFEPDKRGIVNGRGPLSSGRPLHLTFRQSNDPTVTTFANHFQHKQLPDRLTRRSNMKNPFIADRTQISQDGCLDLPKAVTFRRKKSHTEADATLREAAKERSLSNTIGVQLPTAKKAGNVNGVLDRKQEDVAVKVYRSTRKTSTVPREFSVIRRQRRPSNSIKRRPIGKPPVTLSRKPTKAGNKGKANLQKKERSAAKTTATMSGRPSTASLREEQSSIEQAAVKVSGNCSRTRSNRTLNDSQNDGGDMSKLPRRFSTSDEGYDTTHSIEGDSNSNKKLPDIAPPIVRLSPRRLSETETVTVSKTMKALKLENTN